MEPSSPLHQPNSNPTIQTPSFLAHLPSRGLLSSSVVSTNPGGMRVYICEHDTSPPEGQEIKTNQMNILIRSLQIKKQKGDSSSKGGSRKRVLDRSLDTRASKRSGGQSGSRQEGSDNQTPDKDLYSLTVERLRALLKERGLSTRGRKDELVARLRSANG